MIEFVFQNSKVNDKFTSFEAEALSCALEMASLQLYIIDVGTCSSSPLHSSCIMRRKIRSIIEKVTDEVRYMKTFNIICEHVKKETEDGKMVINLPNEIVHNKQRIEKLRLKLLELEKTKSEEIIKMHQTEATLKDKLYEEASWSSVRLKYTDRWETARQSQNRLKCRIANCELKQNFMKLVNESKNEIRVHQELCRFLSLEQQKLKNKLSYWLDKYEKEKKTRDEKMKSMLTKRKERQILIRNLKQLYEERKKEIDEYLDFKKIIQQEKEREELINKMATVIQAWWRGTMVRKGLGFFKKKIRPNKKKIKQKNKSNKEKE